MKKRIVIASGIFICGSIGLGLMPENNESNNQEMIEMPSLIAKDYANMKNHYMNQPVYERLIDFKLEGEKIAKQREEEIKQKEHEEWLENVKKAQEQKRKEREERERKEREQREKEQRERERLAKIEEQKKNEQPKVRTVADSSRTLTVTASAYSYAEQDPYTSEKWGNKTFTGVDVHYGVVAVDPNVIPLHTKMKIEGFGDTIFTALDTGSAIKGNKIDIFMTSYDKCIQFGRKNLKIYILN